MRRAAGLVAMAALLSACAHLDPPRSDPVARLRPAGPSPWRADFGDPALAELLRGADAGALDVKIALARVDRARADVAAARAARSPRVTVGVEAAAGGTSFHDARSAGTPTFEAAYEVDLWGRFARARDAAAYAQAASEADVAAARLMVAAETVRAYTALRAAQDARAGLRRRIDLGVRVLALIERRAAEGAAGHDAVGAARMALSQAQAAEAAALEDEALQTAALGDLLGRPAVIAPTAPLTLVQAAPPAVDSEIVAARPDVLAALSRLRAADARRAEALAASRPQLQLAALLGAPDAAVATLLDARALAWALAGSLTHDLFDGGARKARVQASAADADVADLEYRKAVLAGWSEVRTALADQARAGRELNAAQDALDLGRRDAAAEAVRHREGVSDGLDVARTQLAMEAAQAQLRAARLAGVEARVRLALATGGQ